MRDLLASGAPVASRALLQDAGLRACCALPINCGDGVRRVLVIADSEVRDFEDEELQLFLELADNLALGLRELRSADALVQSEARFRTLAASSPIGILETDVDGSVTYANERMAEIAGTHPEALLGRGWIDFIEPEDRLGSLEELKDWDGEGVKTWQCRIRTPKGAIRHVQGRVAAKSHEGFVVNDHRRHRRGPRTRGAHATGARRSADRAPEPHAVPARAPQAAAARTAGDRRAHDPVPGSRPPQAHQRQPGTRCRGRRHLRGRIPLCDDAAG